MAVLFALLLPLAGTAQLSDSPEEPFPEVLPPVEPEQKRDLVDLRFSLSHELMGDIDFGAFQLMQNQPEAQLRLTVPLAENLALRLRTSGSVHLLDFGGSPDLFGLGPDRSPVSELYTWTNRLQGAYFASEEFTVFSETERWALLAEIGTSSRWESGSSLGEGLRTHGAFSVGYRLGDTLELALGFSVSSELAESGISVGPVVDAEWRFHPDWKVRTHGLGLEIEHALARGVRVFLQGGDESRGYRLARRGGGVGRSELRLSSIPLALGVSWKARPGVRMTLLGGVFVDPKLSIRDEAGNTLLRERGDPAPFFSLRLDLSP